MAQLYLTNSLGGYMSVPKLSQKLRVAAQPLQKFRQFCDPMEVMAKRVSEKVYYDKIANIATAGGTISETSTVPKSNFTIVQGSLTVTEYANAIPMTLKLKSLSQLSVDQAVEVTLRNDMAKVLDSAAAAQFTAAEYKAVVANTATTSFTTDGTATATASGDMSDKNVRDVIDYMKKANIPKYDGSNYICIASTNAIRGLYDFFEAKSVNTTMKNAANGEIGMYYGCRFVEETNVLSNVKGSASDNGEAVFIGADAVREGVVIPEEVRVDVPKDFGRDQAVAWYYLGGFQKVWSYSTDSEEHIVHLTSAA